MDTIKATTRVAMLTVFCLVTVLLTVLCRADWLAGPDLTVLRLGDCLAGAGCAHGHDQGDDARRYAPRGPEARLPRHPHRVPGMVIFMVFYFS